MSVSQTVLRFTSQSSGLSIDLHRCLLAFFFSWILNLQKSSLITIIKAIFDSSRNLPGRIIKVRKVVDLTRFEWPMSWLLACLKTIASSNVFKVTKLLPSNFPPFPFSMSGPLVDIVPWKMFTIRHFDSTSASLEAVCFQL